jgi:hypothetical protein
MEGPPPSKKEPATLIQECPSCSEKQGLLVVNVVDQDVLAVEGAVVTADGLQKTTDQRGVADFGEVQAKVYNIAASKVEYGMGITYWHKWQGNPYPDTVEVHAGETNTATLGLTSCIAHQLKKPFMIAKAKEYKDPKAVPIPFLIMDSTAGPVVLQFGQDFTYGTNRPLPVGDSQGTDEYDLKEHMNDILHEFAKNESGGKYRAKLSDEDRVPWRAYEYFQQKHSDITIYTDPALDKLVADADKFETYPERVLNAPGTANAVNPNKALIHQLLAAAAWDINKLPLIEDIGVVAFNSGNKYVGTGDWGNGLKAMIDTVQYVLVFVDQYQYDSCNNVYNISLIFELYDVFGLDDQDVRDHGTESPGGSSGAGKGITAWWQLQHQFNYAPMITKAVVKREFTISTL